MIKTTLLLIALFLSGCLNKHGVSLQYYSECKEYYDLQGYYHKVCGKDDIITYKDAKEKTEQSLTDAANGIKEFFGEETPKETPPPNVW